MVMHKAGRCGQPSPSNMLMEAAALCRFTCEVHMQSFRCFAGGSHADALLYGCLSLLLICSVVVRRLAD